jgi:hypothetical protein
MFWLFVTSMHSACLATAFVVYSRTGKAAVFNCQLSIPENG